MTTSLDTTLKRELRMGDRPYIVTLSPLKLKLTLKGPRKGPEFEWETLVTGAAGTPAALNASLGRFTADPPNPCNPSRKTANER